MSSKWGDGLEMVYGEGRLLREMMRNVETLARWNQDGLNSGDVLAIFSAPHLQ